MFKKKPDAKPYDGEGGDQRIAPRKRRMARIALISCAPLLLAGAAYAGWTAFAPESVTEPVMEGTGGQRAHVDPERLAAMEAAAAAENSATYSLALAELMKRECGPMQLDALKAASEAEAHADGVLVANSWQAALRRSTMLTGQSCGRLRVEFMSAEENAAGAASPATRRSIGH